MKYELTEAVSKEFGKAISDLLNKFHQGGEVDQQFLGETQGKFYSLEANDNGHELQNELFSQELWQVIKAQMPADLNQEHKNAPATLHKGSIIIETKGGLDIIIDASTKDGHFHIDSYNIDKGGLGPNTAEALYYRKQEFNLVALYGQGPIASIQEKLLEATGVKAHIVRHSRDTNFHPCFNFKDKEGMEHLFWIVAQVYPMQDKVLEQFTNKIDEISKANPGEFMVLTNTPPRGSKPNYFAQLSCIAKKNGNMVIYNPCEFVDTYLADRYLFKEGHADIIKPNLHEFFQFLVSVDLLDAGEMIQKREQVKEELELNDFSTLSKLITEFMQETSTEIAIVSLDKHGALVASINDQLHIPAPVIQVECSSGAGDSGLAGLIHTAKEINLDLNNVSQEDLIKIATEFVYSASATASKKGNQLARLDEIAKLKELSIVEPRVLNSIFAS
ncbi:MAG: PfkB family carbohydrate kinase [Cyanobacteria bacterium]|nr:PfkB family carbohydrate kinase [Cyanobacteriota bacterium]